MNQIDDLLVRVERLKAMGAFKEVLEILKVMQQKLPTIYIKIQKEILEVEFLQGLREEALLEALTYVREPDIWQWLLATYDKPYHAERQTMRQSNIVLLERYEYFYGFIREDECKVLWYDNLSKLYFERLGEVVVYRNPVRFDADQKIVIISNMLDMDRLLNYKSKTNDNKGLPNYKEPIYLYYSQNVFDALIQCIDLTPVLTDSRVVLLIGEEQLESFFKNKQAVMPQEIWGAKQERERINEILQGVCNKELEKSVIEQLKIQEYYTGFKNQIIERIKLGKSKILFLTSRFTTVLQYHIRDCRKAAQKIGLETELAIEQGDIFRVSNSAILSILNSFRPDIIFCIDHFRFEYGNDIPKEIVWISWIQDPVYETMESHTPAKLGKRDFVLNHFISWKAFKKVGYPSEVLLDAPIPASSDIYRIYKLSKEDYDRFACDICFVCHASDVDAHIKEIITQLGFEGDRQQELFKCIYKGYQQYVYKTGVIFYNRECFEEFFETFFTDYFGDKGKAFLPELQKALAEDMYLWYNQRVYRQTLVDWILDAGFTNIKLWGNGWKDNEKYQAYAMGPAENGEMLSKIYQASKIVVGNNIMTTAAARAWETMLSGGFYLSNYIPEEEDVADIRKIVEIGKDVIMFYGKDDLLDKIRFYLEHGEERQIMIERGRKAALEKMTFDILMKRTLSEIAKRLEE